MSMNKINILNYLLLEKINLMISMKNIYKCLLKSFYLTQYTLKMKISIPYIQ